MGLDDLTPKEMVRMAWALAAIGHYSEDLFGLITVKLEPRLAELTLESVTELAWAFAKVRRREEEEEEGGGRREEEEEGVIVNRSTRLHLSRIITTTTTTTITL